MFLKLEESVIFEVTINQIARTLSTIKSNKNATEYKKYVPLPQIVNNIEWGENAPFIEDIKEILKSIKALRAQNIINTDEEYSAYINALKYGIIKNFDLLSSVKKKNLLLLFKMNEKDIEKYKKPIEQITGKESEDDLIKKLNSIFGIIKFDSIIAA